MCKYRKQLAIKRCKHFELGGDKKRKVRDVGVGLRLCSVCLCVLIAGSRVHASLIFVYFMSELPVCACVTCSWF